MVYLRELGRLGIGGEEGREVEGEGRGGREGGGRRSVYGEMGYLSVVTLCGGALEGGAAGAVVDLTGGDQVGVRVCIWVAKPENMTHLKAQGQVVWSLRGHEEEG